MPGPTGRRWPLLAALAAGALVAGMSPALGGANTPPTLRSRADALRVQGASLAERAHGALLDLYAEESRLARARVAVTDLRVRWSVVQREHALVARRALVVEQSLGIAQSRLARVLRDLYVNGQPDAIAIVLGASSLDEAITGIDSLTRTARQNRRLIELTRQTAASLQTLRAELAARASELSALTVRAQAGATQLEQAVRDRSRLLASLRSRRTLTRRAIARLELLATEAQQRSARLSQRLARPRAPAPAPAVAAIPAAATQTQPTLLPVVTQPATTVDAAPVAPAEPQATTGSRTLVVDAVAYHLPGRTASGLPVGVGVIAVDPAVIPLGTRVFVPGYGAAVAADVGSAVRGNIIDLWLPSTAQAQAWGRRTVTITVYG